MPLPAVQIWADGPPQSPTQPNKQEIREWATWVESTISAFTSSGGLIFSTRSDLYADLTRTANAMAWVIGDPVVANNGIYQKVDGAGAGYWRRVGDLPYSFIVATDIGAGTADAIKATSPIPVSASALVVLKVFRANVGAPVTVSFNGGTPLTVKTNSGNDLSPAGLAANMVLFGFVDGANFRLISDQVSSSIVAAAEGFAAEAKIYRDQAANYAALALNNRVLNTFAGNGSTTVFTLSVDPGSRANADINVDGVLQLKSSYTVSGTTLTFSEPPPGDGVNFNVEVTMGGKIDVGTPGNETVSADKINGGDIANIRTKLSVYSKAQVDSLMAVTGGIAGKLYGLTGSNNALDLSNDMDFSAGEAASSGASPVIMALASSLTKRSDAVWSVGNNGGAMDTGTKPSSGWLHWYLIMRPDTGVVDICCSASTSAPSVGTNIPAAYTKYRRIRATKTDASGNILADIQDGDEFLWANGIKESAGAAISTSATAALFTLAGVPTGFKCRAIMNVMFTSTSDTVGAFVSSPDELDQTLGVGNALFNVPNMQNSGGEYSAAGLEIRTNTSGQIRHKAGAAGSLYLFTRGYIDRRGRI